MVLTRHRGDPNDESYSEFVSLQTRSTRRRQTAKTEPNGFDAPYADGYDESVSPSTDYGSGLGTRRKPSAKTVDERTVRTRRHVQVEHEGSSDSDEEYRDPRRFIKKKQSTPMEETFSRRSRRTRRSRGLIPLEDENSEDEVMLHQEPRRRYRRSPPEPQKSDQPISSPGRRPGRPARVRVVETTDDTEEDEEEVRRPVKYTPTRSQRREMVGSGKLVNCDDGSIRRSTRQRKLLYETFNQNLIEKHVMLMGEEEDNDDQEEAEIVQRRKRKRSSEVDPPSEHDGLDMYSRVKRTRHQVKRDMYGIPVNEDDQQEETGTSSDATEEEGGEEGEEGGETLEDQKQGRQYYLRQHKPRTNLYEAPPIEPQRRNRGMFRNDTPPRTFRATSYRSPARKSPRYRRKKEEKKPPPKPPARQKKTVEKEKPKPTRKRAAFHGSSSTSSSSSSDSDDERRFERRKAKSMSRNRNRCLPMNYTSEEVATGVMRDRTKTGTSLADVDPMSIDKTITFDSVGGLNKHIRSLKEMIVFPLLYPEVFERFKISPPRGVLFYGPPGTGKTLVARALANECSSEQRKVAFFMRKGADCLSKWVGESERQLRLLFDQAYQMRPSIIFFDEIDGLAPVRSSRQDQIHSSIVSTLLALMDGLDNRGEIVIIGATNRLDSIDPALRRPGRFDREFHFPLPTVEARKQILQINTKEWNPKLCDRFLVELAGNCAGYCGADLKALCTEGALHALRRRYPQIYTSEDKLELDVTAIQVSARDFQKAMQTIVPASQRSNTSPGRALDRIIKPLLINIFQRVLRKVESIFPLVITTSNSLDAPVSADNSSNQGLHEELCSDDDVDDSHPIYETSGRNGRKKRNGNDDQTVEPSPFLSFMHSATQRPFTYRPRILLAGEPGQGQSTHLGPALLHQLERVPVHVIDLPALYAVSAHTSEEACAQIFREARRTSPSILYMPHIGEFWNVIHQTLQATFMSLLYDLDPTVPVFLVATAETKYTDLPRQIKSMFGSEETVTMENPFESERREFLEDLLLNQLKKPPSTRKQAATRVLEVLPKAKPVEPRKLTEAELKQVQKQEEKHLRELRLFLRDILNKLGRDRKFGIFAKPVDTEDVPDYYDIITTPMDLSGMMTKIDLHQYEGVKEFLDDINLICSNALEYNPDRDPAGRAIRHRACALRDTCQALIEAELDPEFEKICDEIKGARKRRGEKPSATVPAFYYTKPQASRMGTMASPRGYPSRFSRRARGMNTEDQDDSSGHEEEKEKNELTEPAQDNGPKIRAVVKKVLMSRRHQNKNKSPWCRPSRKRYKKIVVYMDEFGNEVPPPGGASGDHNEQGDGDAPAQAEPKEESEDEKTEVDEAIAEKVSDHEGIDEKENKPVINTSPSNKSQPASPSAAPSGRRSTSRQSRSPVSTGSILTRSTSPRSASPRAKRLDQPSETPQRPSQGSPRTSLSMPDSSSKPHSPKVPRRRSSRSSGHGAIEPETMETSPSGPADATAQASPGASSKSNPASPSAAAAPASTSPPSTSSPPHSASAPSASTLNPPNSSDTSSSPTADKSAIKEPSPEKPKEEETMISKLRMTRSRSQVPAAVEAMAKRVLEIDAPTRVIVDDDELRFLLAKAVTVTRNATVEHMERLYCRLSQTIYVHRNNIDKTDLLQDLGLIISGFATNHRSST